MNANQCRAAIKAAIEKEIVDNSIATLADDAYDSREWLEDVLRFYTRDWSIEDHKFYADPADPYGEEDFDREELAWWILDVEE